MTGYNAVITSRSLAINDDIVGKDTPDSIDPADVGNNMIADLQALEPFINAINAFVFDNGTSVPNDANGVENDIYVQTNGGVSLIIWRKTTTNWAVQTTIPLGINYNDGIIIGLRTQIDIPTLSVNVSSGNYAINNVIYSVPLPVVITYDAPVIGSDRIDTIYADESGNVLYLAGSPSSTPVKPTLPSNTIEIDSIYVPAAGTGNAYLLSGSITGGSGSGVLEQDFTGTDLIADGDTWYLPLSIGIGVTLAGAIYVVTSGIRTFPGGLQLAEDGTKITGFLDNTMELIKLKFI